jgi:hypothetical protein
VIQGLAEQEGLPTGRTPAERAAWRRRAWLMREFRWTTTPRNAGCAAW